MYSLLWGIHSPSAHQQQPERPTQALHHPRDQSSSETPEYKYYSSKHHTGLLSLKPPSKSGQLKMLGDFFKKIKINNSVYIFLIVRDGPSESVSRPEEFLVTN